MLFVVQLMRVLVGEFAVLYLPLVRRLLDALICVSELTGTLLDGQLQNTG